MSEKEIWKPVDEFDTYYEISNTGRLKNLKTGNLLTPFASPRGRPSKSGRKALSYNISFCGLKHRRSVASLVIKAHVPNPHGFTRWRSIDGDKYNIHADNLMWVADKTAQVCYLNSFKEGIEYTNFKNNHHIPIAAEHFVCADMLMHGFMAVCDVYPSAPYDVLADMGDGRFVRVQVKSKTSFPNTGTTKFSKKDWVKYEGRVDMFAFVVIKMGIILYIPAHKVIHTGLSLANTSFIENAKGSLASSISEIFGDN